eukprot:TRINITY_DN1234_c1_g3_i2.p1 TRINITY_DN1234_c1_g3~~TRINITY_DN1234_c1_g3_i2.p1  ORF type:complete len:248 (+),score=47.81 TRINITY_DN1234_c1_g3_i2:253-996(+)
MSDDVRKKLAASPAAALPTSSDEGASTPRPPTRAFQFNHVNVLKGAAVGATGGAFVGAIAGLWKGKRVASSIVILALSYGSFTAGVMGMREGLQTVRKRRDPLNVVVGGTLAGGLLAANQGGKRPTILATGALCAAGAFVGEMAYSKYLRMAYEKQIEAHERNLEKQFGFALPADMTETKRPKEWFEGWVEPQYWSMPEWLDNASNLQRLEMKKKLLRAKMEQKKRVERRALAAEEAEAKMEANDAN